MVSAANELHRNRTAIGRLHPTNSVDDVAPHAAVGPSTSVGKASMDFFEPALSRHHRDVTCSINERIGRGHSTDSTRRLLVTPVKLCTRPVLHLPAIYVDPERVELASWPIIHRRLFDGYDLHAEALLSPISALLFMEAPVESVAGDVGCLCWVRRAVGRVVRLAPEHFLRVLCILAGVGERHP